MYLPIIHQLRRVLVNSNISGFIGYGFKVGELFGLNVFMMQTYDGKGCIWYGFVFCDADSDEYKRHVTIEE